MFNLQKQLTLLGVALFAGSACDAGPLVYVVNLAQQFGTVDVATGAFQQIGPNLPEGSEGLVARPNGSLLTLTYAGNLESINPATGVATLIGPTGLGDCTTPASPCGPTAASLLGGFNGKVYATDLSNNLYSVNPLTGASTLIGPTEIPAVPFAPGSMNPDGTFNLYDQTLFDAGGKLYTTFDAFTFDFGSFTVTNTAVAPALYQIDPLTGLATLVGPTDRGIGGIAELNGAYYAFDSIGAGEIDRLDLTNGKTSFVSTFDPALGVVQGASSVAPEPASLALMGLSTAAVAVYRRRKWLNGIA